MTKDLMLFSRAAAAAIALLIAPVATAYQTLNPAVRDLIQRNKIFDASIGVCAIDVETGEMLVSINADRRFIPASNMKLLTSGTALAILGDDFVFRTEFIRAGDRLIVKGSGDPALGDPVILEQMNPALTADELLEKVGEALAKAGIERITEIIIDDRVFDRQRVHPDWPIDQLNRRYCAEVDGVSFHNNVLAVFPRPSVSGPGHSPSAPFQPDADWIEIEIRARTVSKGSNTTWMTREPSLNRFTMLGDVRERARTPVHVTLTKPGLFFGRLLADRLAKQGIDTSPPSGERFSNVRLVGEHEALPEGELVAVITTRIEHILRRCNTDSYNLYAEALAKTTGHRLAGEPGSWENGSAAVKMTLAERLGPSAVASVDVADGSGMSRKNKITPAVMAAWLRNLQSDPDIADAFLASLARVGEGTLRKRFRTVRIDNTVQAKSGLLSEVRTLSGYLTNERTGRRIVFSILVNELQEGVNTRGARQFHEEVVAELDEWLTATVESFAEVETDSRYGG